MRMCRPTHRYEICLFEILKYRNQMGDSKDFTGFTVQKWPRASRVNEWYKTCKPVIVDQSEVVHFRSKYKYLVLILLYKIEFDFNITAKSVAYSATRTPGLLIAVAQAYECLSFKCFTTLKVWSYQ